MALSATIFKADLNIADVDRNYYADHRLTIARHPSETDERMMVRLLAFACHADEQLQFTRGLSSDEDEPDLWLKDLTGTIELWIDVGLPDPKRVRKACGRAQRVVIYVYGRGADMWWQRNQQELSRQDNLTVISWDKESTDALAAMANRAMRLQCTVQDQQMLLTSDSTSLQISSTIWQ
ncbi:MAG: YaeQ family protein [Verrucomicrobiaceae bacterium]|nr:YaeQ family protein [Verrucomicrobiaceae bacterium]